MSFLIITVFLVSLGLALAYGAVWTLRPVSLARSLIKTGSTAGLALIALVAGFPLLGVGLALGAIGDWFLSRQPDDGFLPGLIAFALGHAVYLLVMIPMMGPVPFMGSLVLGLLAFGLLWSIRTGLGALRLPVAVYAAVSVALGSVALALPAELGLVRIGALMFIASDMILAVQLFRLPQAHPVQPFLLRGLWALYWGGQALILLGLLRAASAIDGALMIA